jgi:hypothetical protein
MEENRYVTTLLKGGHSTEDPRLDRVYQLDLRSLNYLVRDLPDAPTEKKPRSYTWGVGEWLDQGQEGACVGFGFAHDLLARPVRVSGVTEKFAHDVIYWTAQKEDEWPGGSYPGATPKYEGSSVLAGAKVLAEMGFYKSYRWGLTPKDVALGIAYDGPCIFGITMYENMMDPDERGFLAPTGKEVGGHCILACAVKIKWNGIIAPLLRKWEDVDLDESFVTVWNSWGPTWGNSGTAKISLRSLDKLITIDHGEACFPKRNPLRKLVA